MNNIELKANTLSRAMRLGLLAGVAATAAAGWPAAPAMAQDESAAALDRIEVTGSRIKRTDIEGALPVTIITREQINLSGDTSVADFLRNTTFNSFGSFRPQSGSSAQSFAGLSLRGLGEGRTLILIDGRRAPIAPNVGSAQDLNSIPLAAVERIEILSDGASAIYGTDAIGGVVNIVTRRDFNGVEITGGISNPKRDGGETEEGSVVFGVSSNRGSLLAGASYNNRGIVFQRERPWSRGGASSFSNRLLNANPAPGTLYGFTPGSFVNNPTFGHTPPGFDCTTNGFFANGTNCFYDFTALAADEAEIRNSAVFARGTFQINDDWSTYLNAGVTRVKSFGRYAPVPSSPWPGGQPFIPVGSPNHPALVAPGAGYDPNVPYFLRHRFAALGPRDTPIETNVYDFMLGFEGRIGMIDLDVGVRQNESKYLELGRNYVVGPIAQQFIADGTYNIYNPFANDPDVLKAMTAVISRDSSTKLREVFAIGSMDMFEMGGGMAGLAFGAEYRSEDYADIYDSLQESGQIVGSAGNSAFGGRNVRAFFAEALFPVIENLEFGLAVRHDDYSDFGSATSPKVSMRWQPIDQLTMRASWGEGFSAPSLDILTAQPAFSAAGINHAPTCIFFGLDPACQTQVTTFSIANPNLEAEDSEQFSIGLAWEPLDWLNMSIDYYDISIENRIAGIGIGLIVNCLEGETAGCPSGLSVLPGNVNPPQPSLGLGVAFGPQGEILYGQTGFTNLGTVDTSGIDLNVRTNFDFADWGGLRNNLQIGYVRDFRTNSGVNTAGFEGAPKYRANLENVWTYGDYSLAWNINYIHSTLSVAGRRAQLGLNDYGYAGNLSSYTTHDLQANWETPWNGRLTLGVTNVADKTPPLDPFDPTGRGIRFDLYDGYGRIPYLRYTQTF